MTISEDRTSEGAGDFAWDLPPHAFAAVGFKESIVAGIGRAQTERLREPDRLPQGAGRPRPESWCIRAIAESPAPCEVNLSLRPPSVNGAL